MAGDEQVVAPEVETPQAEVATTETAPSGEGEPQATPEAQPEKKQDERLYTREESEKWLQKRLAREKRHMEREKALLVENEVLRRMQEMGVQPTQKAQQGDGERPKPENFKDYDAYVEALADYKLEQKLKAQAETGKKQQSEAAYAEFAQEVNARMARGAEKYDDFHEVVGAPGVAITDAMLDAMLNTEVPDDIAYSIAQNPAESRRIASLSIAKQVLEIQKLAEKLTKPSSPTRAPEPIKPNAGSGPVEKTLESTADNYKEWLKLRRKQLAGN